MRLIDADELERRIREAETIFYDSEDVGIAIDCIDATKTISEWHYPSKGEYPKIGEKVFCKDCIGEYNVAEYQGNSVEGEPPWLFNDKIDDYVLAWQYITPPKEEA